MEEEDVGFFEAQYCIKKPLPDKPTEKEEEDYLTAAGILGSHVTNKVYSHVITYLAGAQNKLHVIFRAWSKWGDVWYKGRLS
jgi:hypothetical protein